MSIREFVFTDKSIVEMNIITDVLIVEKIPYKLKTFIIKDYLFDDEGETDFVIMEEMYNIHCFTDLEHFDFVKHIAYKKIEEKRKLEKNYLLPAYDKKKVRRNVQRIHKKNSTNTNSNGRK